MRVILGGFHFLDLFRRSGYGFQKSREFVIRGMSGDSLLRFAFCSASRACAAVFAG